MPVSIRDNLKAILWEKTPSYFHHSFEGIYRTNELGQLHNGWGWTSGGQCAHIVKQTCCNNET